jgi:hypothetical protein
VHIRLSGTISSVGIVGAGAYQCGGTHVQHMGKIGKVTIKKLVGRRGIVRCRILLASKGIKIAEVEIENECRKCIKGDLESEMALRQWFTNHPSMVMSLNCRVLRVVCTYCLALVSSVYSPADISLFCFTVICTTRMPATSTIHLLMPDRRPSLSATEYQRMLTLLLFL